jgi:hypothetical protein
MALHSKTKAGSGKKSIDLKRNVPPHKYLRRNNLCIIQVTIFLQIEHTERREKVIVKYYTWSNRSSEKQTYGRWLLQPINYENVSYV